jgi:hypothetical protein
MPFLVEVNTNLREHGPIVRSAVVMLSRTLRERGRKDIASAGHFGRYAKGWNTSFKAVPGGFVVQAFLRPAFLKVEEYGGVSVGKPLLWIPKPPLRIKARRYGGRLFRPPGSRVLLAVGRRVRVRGMAGTGGGGSQVAYIGVTSVTHRPRFHLRAITQQEAERFIVLMKEGIYSAKTQETVRFG